MKDSGNKNPAGKNLYCITQKIYESKENVQFVLQAKKKQY